MKIKRIKISELKQGPTRHPFLPEELIERIKKFKKVLAGIETSSLAETIENLKRDKNSKKEVEIWEHITSCYQLHIFENAIIDLATRKDVFSVVLGISVGIKNFDNIKNLSKDQINNIIYRYKSMSLK